MKKVIRPFLALTIVLSLIIGTTALTGATMNVAVSQDEARQYAGYYQDVFGERYFSSWLGASLSKPVVFYSINYEPIAFEFTVIKNDQTAGFILISAKKYLPPLLECSDGVAPSGYLSQAQNLAQRNNLYSDTSNPFLLYWGACTYSVQFSDMMKISRQAINLPTGQIVKVPVEVDFKVEFAEANTMWLELKHLSERKVPTENLRLYESNDIAGVPAWQQSSGYGGPGDDGNNPLSSWPSCAGPADDPWYNWDGCTPIAGAMIHGYWNDNGYSDLPDGSDTLIDDNHHFMNTTDDGWTYSVNMDDGLRGVFEHYGYDDLSYDNLYCDWQDIKDEVLADRPAILSMQNNPYYGDHSVTVVGYYESGSTKTVHVHNTWDSSLHIISYGDWGIGTMLGNL